MSFGTNDRILGVAQKLAREVSRISSKEAMRALDTSETTITKIKRGELPNSATFLRAIERFGLRLLEPIIGPASAEYHLSQLDEIERTLRDIRHGVQTGRRLAAGASPEDLGATGRRPGAGLAGCAPHPLVERSAGASEGADRRLARPLEAFRNPRDLSQALSLARAAGNISLVWRPASDPAWRPLYLARMNRLTPRGLIGRPLIEHPDARFGRRSHEAMEEAEDAGRVFARVEAEIVQPNRVVSLYEVHRVAGATSRGERIIAAAAVRLECAA